MGRIPLSVVTGFLGSGKTTLIAALLKQPAMQGTAVIVNEIGAVGIDDAVFAQSLEQRDLVLLANGCLCCAVGDDLAATVWGLIRRPVPPQRIVIETSGLADPAPALRKVMSDPRLRQAARLDSLVATIDAVNGLASLDTQPVAVRQCAIADRRLITKADIADPGKVAELSARLHVLNPGAPIELASHGAIDAEKLFGASLHDPRTGHADVDRWLNLASYRAGIAHDPRTRAFLLEEERPVDWEKLSERLGPIITHHGNRLLRLKGVIRTAADPRPLVIHGVQQLFHAPVWLERWTRKPATSIVAIGDEGAEPAIKLIAEALTSSSCKTTGSHAA